MSTQPSSRGAAKAADDFPPPDEPVCDYYGDGEAHDEFCPHAPLEITRGEVVTACEASARIAIEAYKVMRGEGFSEEEAIDAAVQDAEEGASCFAGVGSCGRGWCKHS